jgi:hypothetical protein
MNNENTRSATNSGATSTRPAHHGFPSEPLSEKEFLSQESARAKSAMQHSLADLKASLRQAADLHLWADRHPWAVVGVAAAAGAAGGAAVAPHRRGHLDPEMQEKLSRIIDNLDNRTAADVHAAQTAEDATGKSTKSSMLAPLLALAKTSALAFVKSELLGPIVSAALDSAKGPVGRGAETAEGFDERTEAYETSSP